MSPVQGPVLRSEPDPLGLQPDPGVVEGFQDALVLGDRDLSIYVAGAPEHESSLGVAVAEPEPELRPLPVEDPLRFDLGDLGGREVLLDPVEIDGEDRGPALERGEPLGFRPRSSRSLWTSSGGKTLTISLPLFSC